jgi:phage anti-repressor protein
MFSNGTGGHFFINIMVTTESPAMTENLQLITEYNGKQAVNARELHRFLGSRQDFSNWIKNRIQQYDFLEGRDYVLLPIFEKQTDEVFHKFMKNPTGGRPSIEYALTVNMAKELSMVEGNEKGKEARRYFIEQEEKAQNLSFAALEYERRIATLEGKLNVLLSLPVKWKRPPQPDYFENAHQLFASIITSEPVRWGELIQKVTTAVPIKQSCAEKRIRRAVKNGIIIKTSEGYIMSNNQSKTEKL